ncbi:MAG: TonB-dependent receptor [Armatimonadota bacterium]|nr:TonB-dependent receptor [Armatimonadota bacterium]
MHRQTAMTIVVALAALLIAGLAAADDATATFEEQPSIEVEVTFSATRTEEQSTDVAASAYTIEREQIDRSRAETVEDLLRTLPGVHVIQQGGFGGATTLINRGGSNNQTLVLVDGVRVNNPMLGGADLANLTLDQVQRVEVVKGPYTTLWGADAMAGVVQIFTRTGGQTDDAVRAGAGNYGSSRADFSWGTGEGQQGVGICGSWLQTDSVRHNSDYDGYTLAGRWDEPLASGMLTLTARYYDYDLGVPGPIASPTPNDRQSTAAGLASLAWTREGLASRDTVRLGYWQEDYDFRYMDFSGNPQASNAEPEYFQASYQRDWIAERSTITAGAEYRTAEGQYSDTSMGSYSADNDSQAVFAQVQYRPEDWRFIAGARWQDYDLFDSETTWRVGLTRLFEDGRRGAWLNYGTAYRIPTFNELYFPGSGNEDLVPETSDSWEVGVWDSIDGDATLELAYFRNEFDDLIQWREVEQFVWQPVNVASASTEGIELSVRRRYDEHWSDRCSLTRLSWWTDGEPLLRRPDWTASYSLGYEGGGTNAEIELVYVGRRLDAVTFPGPDPVASYHLVNVGATHELSDDLEVWVRGNNLLDQDYEAAANYPSPGFNILAGLSTDL